MELSEIRVTAGRGGAVLAELRADSPWGDRGYWITIGGWGGTRSRSAGADRCCVERSESQGRADQ